MPEPICRVPSTITLTFSSMEATPMLSYTPYGSTGIMRATYSAAESKNSATSPLVSMDVFVFPCHWASVCAQGEGVLPAPVGSSPLPSLSGRGRRDFHPLDKLSAAQTSCTHV